MVICFSSGDTTHKMDVSLSEETVLDGAAPDDTSKEKKPEHSSDPSSSSPSKLAIEELLPEVVPDDQATFVDPNNVLNGGPVAGLSGVMAGLPGVIDDAASDISRVTDFTDVSHATDVTDDSHANSEYTAPIMDQPNPFIRRSITSPSPAMKYRIMCQCGAANCRKYLF